MGYCVFMHRSDSIYDDSPAERYQFPKQYLSRARSSIGDWVVYLEPTKVRHSRGYFAIARLQAIIEDPKAPGMYLAVIEPGSYLEFANPVPFKRADTYHERGLLNETGKLTGRTQAAVRPISPQDFQRIVDLGLAEVADTLPREDATTTLHGFEEPQSAFVFDYDERPTQLVSRRARDQAFRRLVIRAYDERCAVTGLKFINGGGRAEVNAAHIQPVEHNGPDSINNGIALSGTAHWMFDRGLISLSDEMEILISRHVNDRDSIAAFIHESGRATLPLRAQDRPHARFLQWHRDNCFKT